MGSVFNPITKQIRRSVNTPDFTGAGWYHIDEALADFLQTVSPFYRKVNGVMNTYEKNAVDASRLPSVKDSHLQLLRDKTNNFLSTQGYDSLRIANIVNLLDLANDSKDTSEITRLKTITNIINQAEQIFETAKISITASTSEDQVLTIDVDFSSLTIPGGFQGSTRF